MGAEVAATLSYLGHPESFDRRRHSREAAVQQAMRIMDALEGAGDGMGLNALRFRAPMPIDIAEDHLHALAVAGLVTADKRGHYRLARPRDAVGTEEIARALVPAH
jgi:DNA-binding IclR family transcriptional regulator